MSVTAILGGQWGDEGKGKILDIISENAHAVARFQGGANAGHTIYVNDQETILHQLPSGILRPDVACLLGCGMVIDPVGLLQEIDMLRAQGVVRLEDRIHLSQLAHVVTPVHKHLDAAQEKARADEAIGTTKRGIGPCYVDRIGRSGLRLKELKKTGWIRRHLEEKLAQGIAQELISEADTESLQTEFETFYSAAAKIEPYIKDVRAIIYQKIKRGEQILVEGAQGTLLDVSYGTYPYVTSSNTIAGNVATGLGIGPTAIDEILGVFKAYNTRVGAGPFPTEQKNAIGQHLRDNGAEYGATTRRPRRCGWFDAALARFAVQVNGFSGLVITKLDVLDDLEEIRICVGYKNGSYPSLDLADCEPLYETLPGWQTPLQECRRYDRLPGATRRYLERIEELLNVPIQYISVGKARDQIIIR